MNDSSAKHGLAGSRAAARIGADIAVSLAGWKKRRVDHSGLAKTQIDYASRQERKPIEAPCLLRTSIRRSGPSRRHAAGQVHFARTPWAACGRRSLPRTASAGAARPLRVHARHTQRGQRGRRPSETTLYFIAAFYGPPASNLRPHRTVTADVAAPLDILVAKSPGCARSIRCLAFLCRGRMLAGVRVSVFAKLEALESMPDHIMVEARIPGLVRHTMAIAQTIASAAGGDNQALRLRAIELEPFRSD